MSQTTLERRREPVPLNGVDTPNLLATINVLKGAPELAKFQFRAHNTWQRGTHSRSRIEQFSGAGAEQAHARAFDLDADHPAVLVGDDRAPTPVEFILHALASCLTAGIANIAAARGVSLAKVESAVEGDIDLRGILGLSDEVRNGYQAIRVRFTIEGDAPAGKLQAIVDQSCARSAVYDIVSSRVPVDVSVAVASAEPTV
jgi:uncharacterized OsmC-like protein